MKRLKAYQVSDGDDGCVIRFATSSAAARREGAGEMGCQWEEVDYCNRKPEYDQFSPGPVPAAVLIANGWGYECNGHRCPNWVTQDTEERCSSAAGTPYCCPTCMARDFARQRGQAAAEVALQEFVELRLPGARVTEVYVYGAILKPHERGSGYSAFADFTFAGARWSARYVFGEDQWRVHGDDIPAFRALYPAPTDETPTTEAA